MRLDTFSSLSPIVSPLFADTPFSFVSWLAKEREPALPVRPHREEAGFVPN
jgi:hypothetical protein